MAGVKGRSGRHTIQKQENNYQVLLDLFNVRVKKDKLEKRIASGKFSAKDMFQLKLIEGDRETVIALFRKVFPDSLVADIQSRSEFEGIVLDEPKKLEARETKQTIKNYLVKQSTTQ